MNCAPRNHRSNGEWPKVICDCASVQRYVARVVDCRAWLSFLLMNCRGLLQRDAQVLRHVFSSEPRPSFSPVFSCECFHFFWRRVFERRFSISARRLFSPDACRRTKLMSPSASSWLSIWVQSKLE